LGSQDPVLCGQIFVPQKKFLVYGSGDVSKHANPNHSRASLNFVEPGLYMLLRLQKAAARGNYETGYQAVSMHLRFLTIRVVYARKDGKILWIRYWGRNGKPCRESSHTADWEEANRKLRERLQARDGNLLEVIRKGEALSFGEWTDSFLKNYSKPPIRAAKTHEANLRCLTHLKAAFVGRKLVELTADAIEQYLRDRLEQRVRVKFNGGYREKGALKSSTVHQEFRVLRRMLNIGVRKKLLAANPCAGVEFPVAVRGLFRPHYVPWSEQERIEAHGPEYLRNVVRIITETGL
jgi:hypothetical protein